MVVSSRWVAACVLLALAQASSYPVATGEEETNACSEEPLECLSTAIRTVDKVHLGFGSAVGYVGGKVVKGIALGVFKAGLIVYLAAHLPALLSHAGQKKWAAIVEKKERKFIEAERELEGALAKLYREYIEPALPGAADELKEAGENIRPWALDRRRPLRASHSWGNATMERLSELVGRETHRPVQWRPRWIPRRHIHVEAPPCCRRPAAPQGMPAWMPSREAQQAAPELATCKCPRVSSTVTPNSGVLAIVL